MYKLEFIEDHFENLAPIAYVADPDFWFVFVRVRGCGGSFFLPFRARRQKR